MRSSERSGDELSRCVSAVQTGRAAALIAGAVRRRGWPAAHRPTAALAVLAAFGVHSAFDFLWHIPVLPLLAAAALVPVHPQPFEKEIL